MLIANLELQVQQLESIVTNQQELIASFESLRATNQRFLELDTGYRQEIADKDARIARLEHELSRAQAMLGFDPTRRGSA